MKLKIGKKTGLKYFDIENVRSWQPCYAPEKHLQVGKRYNILDILEREDIPPNDRLWVALRTDLVSEKLMRLFAVWCARQVLKPEHDDRSHKAVEIAERFANGQATIEELNAAESAAWSAVWSAARSAAESAAWSAAWSAQIKKLIEMITIEGKERISQRKRK